MYRAAGTTIHRCVTPDQVIHVVQDRSTRSLYFGNGPVQGRMLLSDPYRLALTYTQAMAAFLLFRDAPRSSLQIGLGAASLTKFLWQALPACRIDVVEYSAEVVDIARRFFHMPDDARVRVHIGEGASFIQRPERAGYAHQYELILVDAYNAAGMAGPIGEEAFFVACRDRLLDEGILVINLWNGRTDGYEAVLARIDAAFEGRLLCLPVEGKGNVAVLAFNRSAVLPATQALRDRARALEMRYDLPFSNFVRQLHKFNTHPRGGLALGRR